MASPLSASSALRWRGAAHLGRCGRRGRWRRLRGRRCQCGRWRTSRVGRVGAARSDAPWRDRAGGVDIAGSAARRLPTYSPDGSVLRGRRGPVAARRSGRDPLPLGRCGLPVGRRGRCGLLLGGTLFGRLAARRGRAPAQHALRPPSVQQAARSAARSSAARCSAASRSAARCSAAPAARPPAARRRRAARRPRVPRPHGVRLPAARPPKLKTLLGSRLGLRRPAMCATEQRCGHPFMFWRMGFGRRHR